MGLVKIKLRKFQIFLLELDLTLKKESEPSVSKPYPFSWQSIAYPELMKEIMRGRLKKERWKQEQEIKKLKQLIRNLKRRGYLEEKREADKKLFRLTAKAQFEILYTKFLECINNETTKKWDGRWRLVVFDIPEVRRKSRNTFRKIIKSGFVQLQQSVWITPYNIMHDAAGISDYLDLSRFVEYFEILKLNNEKKYLRRFDLRK